MHAKESDRHFPTLNSTSHRLLFTLGFVSRIPYLAALGLGDLRKHTIEYEVVFFAAFAFYAAACALALRLKTFSRKEVVAAFVLAGLMGGLLVLPAPPCRMICIAISGMAVYRRTA